MTPQPRLLIITPCRDEEENLGRLIRSMAAQERPPDRWIIVDDGSTDGTADVVRNAAKEHEWIELAETDRSGSRALGAPVVRAFERGLAAAGDDPWEVIGKLDADLELPPDAIVRILDLFGDTEVGAAGPGIYLVTRGGLEFERYPSHFVPGQAKFYRRECFEAINGFRPIIGWDYIDVVDARRRGWKTVSDPSIVVRHYRLMGEAHGSLKSRVRWGHATYIVGSHPLFALVKGLYRMRDRPRIVGGLAIIAGFVQATLDPRIVQIDDAGLIDYLQREQLYRLTHRNRLPPNP